MHADGRKKSKKARKKLKKAVKKAKRTRKAEESVGKQRKVGQRKVT